MLTGKQSEGFKVAAIFWITAASVAAPIIAVVGLHDFNDTAWYRCLMLLPLLPALVLLSKWAEARNIWKRLNSFERYRKPLLIHTIAFTLIAMAAMWFLSKSRDVTLTICNGAPYKISTAVNYKSNRREWRTEGYLEFAPRECKNFEAEFLRETPKFYVLAAKKEELDAWLDGEAVAWNFDQREELAWVHGAAVPAGEAASALNKKLKGEDILWEMANTRCVGKSLGYINGAAVENSSGDCSQWEEAKHKAAFVEVPYSFEDGDTYSVWFLRGGRDVTMEMCNFTPYDTSLALHYQTKRAEWITEAYATMRPGECRAFERNVQRVEPRFYAHAFAAGEVVKWHLNRYGAEDEMRSDGEDIAICLPDNSNSNDVIVRHLVEQSAECTGGQTLRGFAEVPVSFADSNHQTSEITSPLIPLPRLSDGTIDRNQSRRIVSELGNLLPARKAHWERFPPGMPLKYTLGIMVSENISAEQNVQQQVAVLNHVPGVVVTDAMSQTPFGVGIPFQKGDEIIEFDGKTIYAPEDLRDALIDFAESPSKGVMVRYSFKLWRGTTPLEGFGVFYFNEAGWERSAAEQEEADSWGWTSGLTIGHAVEWTCRKDSNPYCKWSATQRLVRLKQMYPDEYGRGSIKGGIVSGLVGFGVLRAAAGLLRWLGLSRGAALAAEVIGSTVVGAAEAALWAAKEAPPGADVRQEVREAIRRGGTLGFAVAFIGR